MSDYITYKLVIGVVIVIAAFFAGLFGFLGPSKNRDDDEQT